MSDPYMYYNSIKDTPVCGHLNLNCLKLNRALGNAELRVLVHTFFSLGRMNFARRESHVRMFF